MNKKLITILFTASLMFFHFNSTNVSALSSADELYVKAYNATSSALNSKTQASINKARDAVSALSGTGADWAIGEFSHQLDLIQNPILVRAIEAINNAKANPIQENIDAAKKAIDPDLPTDWKNSYSSAVDAIQQEKMKVAVEASNTAATSYSQSDIDYANSLLFELQTAADASIAAWAKTLNEEIYNSLPYRMYVEIPGNALYTDSIEKNKIRLNIVSNPSIKDKPKYGKAKVVINITSGNSENVKLTYSPYESSTNSYEHYDVLSEPFIPDGGITMDNLGLYGNLIYAEFSKTGSYTIRYSLVEIDSDEIITTYTQNAIVKTAAEVDNSKPILTITSIRDKDGNGKIDTIICTSNKSLPTPGLGSFKLTGDGIANISEGITSNAMGTDFIIFFNDRKFPDGLTFVNGNDINMNASDIKLEYVGNNVLAKPSDGTAIITFKDKNLEQTIRNAINKPSGDITKGEVASIRNLWLDFKSITDISEIENLYNLEILNIRGNSVSDISPLLKLENLLYLNITNNPISEKDKQVLADFMQDNYILK